MAEPCKIISREMLYTALTRQLEKIIILYNQAPYHLLNYSSDGNSDIATRFTDLFADVFKDEGPDLRPQIVELNGKFYEEKMIHKTARGELVRSKSEVIIANALYYNKLDYEYEPEIDRPVGGGSWVSENGYGHEMYNFKPEKLTIDGKEDEYCLGFFETKSTNGQSNNLHIEKIRGI